jgi:ArsR family transcriptional regulator
MDSTTDDAVLDGRRDLNGDDLDFRESGPSVLSPVERLDDDRVAAMAKALGHPLRMRIVRLLLERQACVTGDLVAELPVAQSTVSEHLRILRSAGIVQGEIEGPRTSYCVNRGGLDAFKASIAGL